VEDVAQDNLETVRQHRVSVIFVEVRGTVRGTANIEGKDVFTVGINMLE
jgi:hypothetical protein